MYTPNANRYKDMPYNKLGKSGLKISALTLGLWKNFGSYDNLPIMESMVFTAFDCGIVSFDLANNYGMPYGSSEINFGKILKKGLGTHREELCISTKAGYDMWPGPYGMGGSRKYLISSLNQSLRRMGIEYVDIFYHHAHDKDTPAEEVALALDQIVRSGKALYVGISNYNKEQTEEIYKILEELKTPFVVNQIEYSMLNQTIEKNGLKEYAKEKGIGLVAYGPLAKGLLTGKYLQGIPADSRMSRGDPYLKPDVLTPELFGKVTALTSIAYERGQKLSQMALSWILRDGIIQSVVVGASRPEQIIENIYSIYKTSFSDDEVQKIADILKE
jgi:L-glyceraldehyde 3-phosphate reductase